MSSPDSYPSLWEVSFPAPPDSGGTCVVRFSSGMILNNYCLRDPFPRKRAISAPSYPCPVEDDILEKPSYVLTSVSEPYILNANLTIQAAVAPAPSKTFRDVSTAISDHGWELRPPTLPDTYPPEAKRGSFSQPPPEIVPLPKWGEVPPDQPLLVSRNPYSDSGQVPCVSYAQFQELTFMDIVLQKLNDPAVNPYRGSVPLDKIQYIMKSEHMNLYAEAIGRDAGLSALRRFLDRYREKVEVFSYIAGKWRIRVVANNEWKERDEAEREARKKFDEYFVSVLTTFLCRQPPNSNIPPEQSCTVNDFMISYPDLPFIHRQRNGQPLYELPVRGDFVRLVERYPNKFKYHKTGNVIVLC